MGAEFTDETGLVLGPQIGMHFTLIDARLGGQRGGGGVVVAGEHRDPVARFVQGRDDFRGFGAQFVADRDGADQDAIVFDQDGGGTRVLDALHVLGQGPGGDPARSAQPHATTVQNTGEPGPGDRFDRLGPLRGGGCGQDGAGERVFAALLQRGGHRQHLLGGAPRGRYGLDHGRAVTSQGAGLVQGHGLDMTHGLQGGSALDQGAVLGGRTDRGDHGHRHRDGQCARGSGHQHHQRTFDPHQRVAEQGPQGGDEYGGDHHPGYQGRGDAVGQALSGALAGLLGLHDGHDAGQGVVGGGGGHGHFQHAGAVDGTGEHLVAGTGLHGDGLTGDGGGVQTGVPGGDTTVGGQAFPRAHHQRVAHDQIGRVHGLLGSLTQHPGLVGGQIQQGAQAAPGAGHGVLLQPFGDGVEHRQHRGLAQLAQQHRAHGGDGHQRAHADPALCQAAHGGRDERPPRDGQGGDFEHRPHQVGTPDPARAVSCRQEQCGHGGEADLAHLPQSFRLRRLGLAATAGLVSATSARITHRAPPSSWLSVP